MGYSRKAEGLVLARRKRGEADRWLTLFTKQEGLIGVTAKGVRKIPSRRGGHVEPLTRVMMVLTGSREHTYLTASETLDYYSALRSDSAAVEHASIVSETLVNLLEEHHAYPTIYNLLHHSWKTWPTLSDAKRCALEGALLLSILRQAGVLPNLRACYTCGSAKPHEAVILDGTAGGWHCLSCHHGLAGTEYSLAPQLLPVLRWLAGYPRHAARLRLESSLAEQIVTALRQYVTHTTGYPLRSQRSSLNLLSSHVS